MNFKRLLILCFVLASCSDGQVQVKNDEPMTTNDQHLLFVGTYTDKEGHVDGQADGIYALTFNSSSGMLQKTSLNVTTTNPSYLHVDKENGMIYSVNEKVGEGEKISAFTYSEDSITLVNQLPAEGGAPCHISLIENHLLTANYVGGNHVVYSLDKDGGLNSITQVYDYEGKGVTDRQEASHAHMIIRNPHSDQVLGVDLGTDIITYFDFDRKSGMLSKASELKLADGSGPRHVDFHPEKDITYVINELNGSVDVIKKVDGRYQSTQNIPSTINTNRGDAGCAAIKMHVSGKYLFASNRGPLNTIAVYKVDAEGDLSFHKEVNSQGLVPRDFEIDPTGRYLLVAHQNSDDIIVFEFDAEEGDLTEKSRIDVPTPVCLKFE